MAHRPDHDHPGPLPLADWEEELGRLLAHRFAGRAKLALAGGEWSLDDLEDAVAAAERRLTARQREALWQAITTDRELTRLAAVAA